MSRKESNPQTNVVSTNCEEGKQHGLDDSLIIWWTEENQASKERKNVSANTLPAPSEKTIRAHAESARQGISFFHQFLDTFRIRRCQKLM